MYGGAPLTWITQDLSFWIFCVAEYDNSLEVEISEACIFFWGPVEWSQCSWRPERWLPSSAPAS